MANRNPDTERREGSTSGNGHHRMQDGDYGARESDRSDRTGSTERTGSMYGRSTAGSGTEADTGGRYYTEAMRRGREGRRGERDDRLLGMGFARSGRGMRGGAEYAREDWHANWRDEGRSTRGTYDPTGHGGYPDQDGEFEHRRMGFRDFGTPSHTQGRAWRSTEWSDRDFSGRDDSVAGRSGMSYHPEQMETRTYRPPEEDWERSHRRGFGMHRQDRGHRRVWEEESSTAEDIMTSNPRTVGVDANLREVAEIMRAENTGIVPVVNTDRRLIGLITDRDMVMRTADSDRPWTQIRAREVMTDEIDAVTPDEPVREIIELMGRKQVRRVPVVDRNDRLLGIIAMADVANRADRDEELQHALDRVSKRRSFWRKLWS